MESKSYASERQGTTDLPPSLYLLQPLPAALKYPYSKSNGEKRQKLKPVDGGNPTDDIMALNIRAGTSTPAASVGTDDDREG